MSDEKKLKKVHKATRIKPYQLHTYELSVSAENIYDGDTIKKAEIGLGFGVLVKKDLRLARINTPEIRTRDKKEKELGYASKDYLISLIADQKNITVHITGKGKYGRWIAEIFKDGNNISDIMISSGYAKEYKK